MNTRIKIFVIILIIVFSLCMLSACKDQLDYTVIFDGNGGLFTDGEGVFSIVDADTVTLPEPPIKPGYVFANWYTDNELSTIFDAENPSASNVTLYAGWTANTNTLNFDNNDGVGSMEAMQIDTGETAELSANAFSKPHYIFSGWATSASGKAVYADEADYIMGTDAVNTLYAVWVGEDILLTVDCGFFSFEITAKYGGRYIDYLLTPESAGYAFNGWTANIGSGIAIGNDTIIDCASDHTVTANWTAKEFEVTMDANGGGAVDSIDVTFDDEYGTIPLPSRIGYTFDGWFTERSGGSRVVEFSTVKNPSNHTLYAHWIPNVYTVEFDGNNGSEVDDLSVTYDAAYGELPLPERLGYSFDGWYTSLVDGTKIVSDTIVKIIDTQTLYAIWNTVEYDIEYIMAEGTNNVDNPASYNIEDDIIEILEPTKAGYTFTGWFASDLTTPANTTIDSGSTGDRAFYAVWEANINNLAFNANGGEGSMDAMTIATDATDTLDANLFTRDGYTFAGWATSSSGEIAYADEASYTMGTAAEYTLYAVWNTIEYDIDYILADGTNNVDNPASYNIEDDIIEILDPTKAGYTFTGWFASDLTTPANTTIASGSTGDRAFYAVWEANINNLAFDANGGEGSMDNMEIATDATDTLDANLFTRDGYTFAGWATSPSGEIAYADEASYTMGTAAEYTLYAVWDIVEYDIDYEMDNGTNHIDNPASYNIEDESITILSPTRAGYTFTGWYDSDLETPANTTIASGSTGDRAFYAVWEANINDLIFDSNGGEGSMDNMEIATDAIQALNANLFTKTGYTFAGWATSASGEIEYADEASYTMGTDAEYTLYAVWEAKEYTVSFDQQSGSGGSDSVTATYDSSMPEADAPTRTGYTFGGYYTQTSGGGTAYYTAEMASAKDWDIDSDTTLFAKWTPNNYTLTFNINGGDSVTPSEKTVTYDSAVSTLPEATRIGHTFLEWNTASNGSGTTYTDATVYTVASNLSLYAKWQINQYTISFESNGGTEVASITQDYNSVVLEPAAPTKDDFVFAGWYSDEAITEFFVFDRIPAENITLYADWGTVGLGFDLINDNNEYAVNKGFLSDGTPMAIRIPRRYNGKEVTSLGNKWSDTKVYNFMNIFITSIHIPSSITVIEEYALHGITHLTSITIPSSVTKIGMLAFNGSGLTSVNIPGSVTEIGDYAFQLCAGLTSITFNEGLEKIGRGAFAQCNGLTSIELPSTLTDLGGFYGSFDDAVFADCASLASVTINAVIPPTLSGETTMIFKGCGSLTDIYVPSQSVNAYKTAQGWSAYAGKISAITD